MKLKYSLTNILILIPNILLASEPYLVKDIWSGSNDSFPQYLTNVNNVLYFNACDSISGCELWKSDGTFSGTVLVKDIRDGIDSSSPKNLINVDGILYFNADDGINGRELWKSDGTPEGTVLIKDIWNGNTDSLYTNNTHYMNIGNTLYFSADDGINGRELWKTDGTSEGTVLIKDIWNGDNSSHPIFLTNVNNTLYFTATDNINGQELWKTDGTPEGTILVKDIRSGIYGSTPMYLTVVGNTLFFTAYDNTTGWELWKSDGTSEGTILVKDIWNGNLSSLPTYLTEMDGILYFHANTDEYGRELWKSDGTFEGTILVKDIQNGNLGSSPHALTTVNKSFPYQTTDDGGNTLYFSAYDEIHGRELWKSDGTSEGTILVKDIQTDTSHFPNYLKSANGILYFIADDNIHDLELWKSDGTFEGTILVKDINFKGDSFNKVDNEEKLVSLVKVNNILFFRATNGNLGNELWALFLNNDIDEDGILNDIDNCLTIFNDNQTDFDKDNIGDLCDIDADGDGIKDNLDNCLWTSLEEIVVDIYGCGINQLCPCNQDDFPSYESNYLEIDSNNSREYMNCINRAIDYFLLLELITLTEKRSIISAATESNCGPNSR